MGEDIGTMLCVATAGLGALTLVFLLVRHWVRTDGKWALWWHDNIYEKFQDFVTGRTRPERLLQYLQKNGTRGDANNAVDTIDRFCGTVEWAMNVGGEKGKIVDKVVQETNPRTILELGTYCGYSAVRMGRLLGPGSRLITLEMNPAYAKVAKQVIAFAGMDKQVEVLVGSTTELIPQLKKKFDIDTFDMIFLDHWKQSYLPDTKLLEECGLLRKGTVLLADNVICPGTPDYLQYVRNSPKYLSQHFPSVLEYTNAPDGLEKSVYLG